MIDMAQIEWMRNLFHLVAGRYSVRRKFDLGFKNVGAKLIAPHMCIQLNF